MQRRFQKLAVCLAIVALAATPSQASVIISATGVSSPQGDFGGAQALVNIINQSGLSAGYTSGVTNFGTYTAATTHAALAGTGFTNAETNGPQQFTFDLGAVTLIDALAIWNTDSVGRVTSFRVFADNDGIFGNGVGALLVGPTALGGFGPAQVFAFGPVSTRFIHIEGLSSLAPPDFYGLGEVVFRAAAAVPEPGTLVTCAAALLVGVGFARRRRPAA